MSSWPRSWSGTRSRLRSAWQPIPIRSTHDRALPEGAKLWSAAPDAAIEFMYLASAPGLDADEEAAITRLVRALTGDSNTRKVTYRTEAKGRSQPQKEIHCGAAMQCVMIH